MFEPRRPKTLWVSTASYRDSFNLPFYHMLDIKLQFIITWQYARNPHCSPGSTKNTNTHKHQLIATLSCVLYSHLRFSPVFSLYRYKWRRGLLLSNQHIYTLLRTLSRPGGAVCRLPMGFQLQRRKTLGYRTRQFFSLAHGKGNYYT
jgi:hypothetical protein